MLKARRLGHWFRLSRTERAFFSLATRLQVKYESYTLMRAMVAILRKLEALGDSACSRLLKGMLFAWSFSEAAVRWGNNQARSWRNDRKYVLFLGSFHMRETWDS